MDRLASFLVFLGMAVGLFVVGAEGLVLGYWFATTQVHDAGFLPLETLARTGLRIGAAAWAVTILVLTIAAIVSLVKPQLYRLRFLFATEPY